MTNKDFAKRVAIVILAIAVILIVVLFVDFADGGLDDGAYRLF